DMTDDEIWALRRGGLDYRKVYAAYKVATELGNGKPTVILAKTIKGWTLGPDVEGRNATHQIKELTNLQLMQLRETLHLDKEIPAESLEGDSVPPYFRPGPGTPEYEYLQQRRQELGGLLPMRVLRDFELQLPVPESYAEIHAGSGKIEASTTTAFTRLLRNLSRVEGFGERVVPIVPDEARTFGMDSLFRELKIYASHGQLYESVDASMLLTYAEAQDGQILEEGITEAGSVASWIAAATSYATRGLPMIPFFIFYSMFGFQRVGDLIWSAADSRARGFLLGATAGRTTLQGEGLQHQDGHSLILASTVPVCDAYDPAFAYEVGTIVEHGLQRMYGAGEDRFYYLTLYNENYVQPPRPEGVAEGVIEGLYRWQEAAATGPKTAILFSGSANLAAREAASELAEHYGVAAELWSATSYKKLREEALGVERWNRLHPDQPPRAPLVTRRLSAVGGPVIAVTDFMKLVPDQIARWVPSQFVTLGTDGFGRSDSRQALRKFFEIDAGSIVAATLWALSKDGLVPRTAVQDAFTRYGIDPETPDPAHQH
ncbi:MAG TPA: pyruvate dehydrogenase (acetyl-transferring), homodimeric type, partial [Acidimicrobiia bacterium]|nr:pyruvate dehydrogenase (acetyl-transferring), homodimeric type [Acidimicrobiia bacterium]